MAKYDNVGDVKRRRVPRSLVSLIIGIVIFAVGIVLIKATDTKSLGKRYSVDETVIGAEIKEIDLDLGMGIFRIEPSSDDDIHIKGEYLPEKLNIKSSSGRLEVQSENNSFLKLGLGYVHFDDKDPYVTIQLPAKEYSYVNIDGGAGKLSVTGLKCEVLDVDFGAGESVCENVTATRKAELDLGVGNTTFENCIFGETDMDCGIGDLSFSGEINGDCEIDGGIGSIEVKIKGARSDYRIEDGDHDDNSSGDAKYTISVDSGIGKADVGFID